MKTINASEFKTKCLAILDEVASTGETVTILKRGKPVAQLVPPVPRDQVYPQYTLIGKAHITDPNDDLTRPPLEPEAWDANRGEL